MMEHFIVKLRAPEPEDLDLLYVWENDPEIWSAGQTLTPFSRFILTKYLEDAHRDIFDIRQVRFMIDKVSGKSAITVGTIDLFDYDPLNQRAGVGVLIGDKSERNKGIAGEAIVKLKEYAFDVLQLHQIYCSVKANNQISVKLFKDAGFMETGIRKEWNRNGSNYHDEVFLQFIRSE